MKQHACPERSRLSAFATCSLTDQQAEQIAEHLTVCRTCDETLAELEQASDRILQAAEPKQDSYADEPEFISTLNALQRISPDGNGKPDGITTGKDSGSSFPTSIGDYQILGKLGEGGMGVVYEAWHTRLKRKVAIKVLPAELFGNQRAIARFQREMAIIGRLDHPHVVRASDAGEKDNTHFLVMEFIEGRNLSELARQIGPLRIADACAVIVQTARALQYAHEHRLVHRDIKPSNLMLAQPASRASSDGHPSPQPTIKLLDLGLAVLRDEPTEKDLTTTGQVMGTMDYIAPEQAEGSRDVDIRADIYGLGATLYRLLAGHAPFGSEEFGGRLSKLAALANREPRRITEIRPDVPETLADTLHKMLAKRPNDRFQVPAEVVSALAPFCHGARLSALLDEKPAFSNSSSALAYEHKLHQSPHPCAAGDAAARRRMSPTFLLGIALLGVVLGAAALVTYRLSTNVGTLVIEIDDPFIEIALKTNGFVLRDTETEKQWKITTKQQQLPAAHYELTDASAVLVVTDPQGGETTTRQFTLRRGQELRARIRLVLNKEDGGESVLATQGDWKPGPPAALPGLIPRPSQFGRLKDWQAYLLTPRRPTAAAWSPDGAMIAIGSAEGLVRVYRVENQEFHPHRFFPGHRNPVASLSWDKGGKRLVSQGRDVRLWNVESGKQEAVLPPDAHASWQIWNWSTDRIMVGSLDGRLHFLSGSGNYLSSLEAHDSAVVCMDWSEAGKRLATLDAEGTATLWNETPNQLVSIPVGKTARQCRLSPDGKLLAVRFLSFGSAPGIHVYDTQSGDRISSLPKEQGWHDAIDWLSNDVLAASRYDGRLMTWQVADFSKAAEFRSRLWSASQLKSFSIAPGGKWAVACLWYTGPKLVDLANRRLLSPLPEGPADFTWASLAPNSERIALGAHDGRAWVFNRAGRLERIIDSGWGQQDSFAVTFKDAQTLVLSFDGKLDLYNVDDGSFVNSYVDLGAPLGWSPGGKYLALRSPDGSLQLWSPDPAFRRVVLKKSEWIDARWSPQDDTLAVSRPEGAVLLYTVADGPTRELEIDAGGGLAWLPDGGALLSIAQGDAPVKAWDVQSNTLLWTGPGSVGPLAVDPAQAHFAAVGGGVLADASNGHPLSHFPRLQRSASWTRDGSQFVYFDDTSLNVWDGRSLQPLWKAVPVDSEQALVLSAAGDFLNRSAPLAKRHLVFVIREPNGSFSTRRYHEIFAPGGNSFDGLP